MIYPFAHWALFAIVPVVLGRLLSFPNLLPLSSLRTVRSSEKTSLSLAYSPFGVRSRHIQRCWNGTQLVHRQTGGSNAQVSTGLSKSGMVDLLGVIRVKLENILTIGKLGKMIGAREHLTKCEQDHEGKTESPEDGRSDPTKVDSRFFYSSAQNGRSLPSLAATILFLDSRRILTS